MDLLQNYIKAREDYNDAKELMEHYEQLICNAFKYKEEGATSHEVDGYKLTITGRINRKLDAEKLALIADQLPAGLIKYKPDFSVAEMRKLSAPDYLKFSSCMTAAPGKPSVSVTKI